MSVKLELELMFIVAQVDREIMSNVTETVRDTILDLTEIR